MATSRKQIAATQAAAPTPVLDTAALDRELETMIDEVIAEEQAPPAPSVAVALRPTFEVMQEVMSSAVEWFEKPRSSLREIAWDAVRLDMVLQSNGGELTPELERVADEISAALVRKADGCVDYLAALDADTVLIDAEVKRLQALSKHTKSRAAKFEEYITKAMQTMGTTELAGDLRSLKLRTNPPALVIDDEAAVPARYKTTVTPPPVVQIDTKQLKADLVLHEKMLEARAKLIESGVTIEGGEQMPVPITGARITRGTSLKWK